MHKRDLQIASVFSILYGLVGIFYSYSLINQFLGEHTKVFLLLLVTSLVAVILVLFRNFLKYYYNFKDQSNLILWIIILEFLHALFVIIFSRQLKESYDLYFLYSSLALFLSAILLIFYAVFATKLISLSKKRTILMKPFALSFFLIPLITILSFVFSLIRGENMVKSIEYNNSALILTILKMIPFLMLPFLYTRAYNNKKKHHSYSQRY